VDQEGRLFRLEESLTTGSPAAAVHIPCRHRLRRHNAGRNATRSRRRSCFTGLTVSALDLQGEKDPDSVVQKQGADRFLELLGNATDIFEFGLGEWAGDVAKLTGREKSERVEQFVPLLSAVSDPVVRNDAAQRLPTPRPK
jgi:DNA primase